MEIKTKTRGLTATFKKATTAVDLLLRARTRVTATKRTVAKNKIASLMSLGIL